MMNKISIPPVLKEMNAFFEEKGFEAYLVGGAVRDFIRGKKPSDFDVATNAKPEDVVRIFRKVIPTGIEHGTVTVLFKGYEIEVTTYRLEKDYTDARHPDSVVYTNDITEDLSRRDFTMNAIAASLKDGTIADPFDGRSDIGKKIIRTVGNPDERFNEDGLRPIRAIRFASQTGFAIEDATLKAIPAAIEKTKTVSIERFRDEFTKIICSQNPSQGLRLLEQAGLLDFFLPELSACRGVEQADARGHHKYDVLDHMFMALEGAAWLENQRDSVPNQEVRLASLFHDVGKPCCKKDSVQNGETIHTFFNHDNAGAKITDSILTRLRYPKATSTYVSHLVKQHMFFYESSWTDAAIRRFLVRITPPGAKDTSPASPEIRKTLEDLFDLRISDVCGMSGIPACLSKGPWAENLCEFKDRIEKISAEQTAISLKDLAVSGKDLIANGFESGRELGMILNELLNAVIDEPDLNTKEKLFEIAEKLRQRQTPDF